MITKYPRRLIPSPSTRKMKWLESRRVPKRNISTTPIFLADPNNGLELDSNEDILNSYGHSKQEFDNYFTTKTDSINNSHRVDSNNAAIDGTPSSELQTWMDERDSLLKALDDQKYDIESLNPELDSDYESSSSSDNTPSNQNFTGEGDNDEEGNNTSGTHSGNDNFRQNSEEITDEAPSSWEPFED